MADRREWWCESRRAAERPAFPLTLGGPTRRASTGLVAPSEWRAFASDNLDFPQPKRTSIHPDKPSDPRPPAGSLWSHIGWILFRNRELEPFCAALKPYCAVPRLVVQLNCLLWSSRPCFPSSIGRSDISPVCCVDEILIPLSSVDLRSAHMTKALGHHYVLLWPASSVGVY